MGKALTAVMMGHGLVCHIATFRIREQVNDDVIIHNLACTLGVIASSASALIERPNRIFLLLVPFACLQGARAAAHEINVNNLQEFCHIDHMAVGHRHRC